MKDIVEYPAYADDEYWSEHGPTISHTALAWSQEDFSRPLFGMESRWSADGSLAEHPSILVDLANPSEWETSGTWKFTLVFLLVFVVLPVVTVLIQQAIG